MKNVKIDRETKFVLGIGWTVTGLGYLGIVLFDWPKHLLFSIPVFGALVYYPLAIWIDRTWERRQLRREARRHVQQSLFAAVPRNR
jgi:hypothetical protein